MFSGYTLHMVRFRGPGRVDPGTGKINGDELRRSEEKPGAPEVGGGHGVIGGPWRGLWFSDEPVGAFYDAPFAPFKPINRDVIYPPDYRRFWIAPSPDFHG
jgi:hypothetical protein